MIDVYFNIREQSIARSLLTCVHSNDMNGFRHVLDEQFEVNTHMACHAFYRCVIRLLQLSPKHLLFIASFFHSIDKSKKKMLQDYFRMNHIGESIMAKLANGSAETLNISLNVLKTHFETTSAWMRLNDLLLDECCNRRPNSQKIHLLLLYGANANVFIPIENVRENAIIRASLIKPFKLHLVFDDRKTRSQLSTQIILC